MIPSEIAEEVGSLEVDYRHIRTSEALQCQSSDACKELCTKFDDGTGMN